VPHDHTVTWKESVAEAEKDPMWQKAVRRFMKKGMSLDEINKQHRAWKSKHVSQVMSKSGK
jgi:hypothetical protein